MEHKNSNMNKQDFDKAMEMVDKLTEMMKVAKELDMYSTFSLLFQCRCDLNEEIYKKTSQNVH